MQVGTGRKGGELVGNVLNKDQMIRICNNTHVIRAGLFSFFEIDPWSFSVCKLRCEAFFLVDKLILWCFSLLSAPSVKKIIHDQYKIELSAVNSTTENTPFGPEFCGKGSTKKSDEAIETQVGLNFEIEEKKEG